MAGPVDDLQLLLTTFKDHNPTVVSHSRDQQWVLDIAGVRVDFDNQRDHYIVDIGWSMWKISHRHKHTDTPRFCDMSMLQVLDHVHQLNRYQDRRELVDYVSEALRVRASEAVPPGSCD